MPILMDDKSVRVWDMNELKALWDHGYGTYTNVVDQKLNERGKCSLQLYADTPWIVQEKGQMDFRI